MAAVTAQVSDLLLHNATVHTVDPKDTVAEAIAIAGGRILAVGRLADVEQRCGPSTRRVDLGGRTVVPGFVDAHPHMDSVGLRLTKPAFNNPKSIADIQEVIRKEVARRKPGEWIICNPVASEPEVFGYPAALAEGRWPNRHDLDKVSPDNPVYIEPPSLVAPGHAFANSAAIRLCGIRKDSPVKEGVEIEVDASGEPTGVFRDINFPKWLPVRDGAFRAQGSLFPAMPELTDAETLAAVAAGAKAFNEAGITTIYEGHGIPVGPQRAYMDLWNRKQLTVRTYFVVSYPIPYYRDREKGNELIEQTARYAGGNGFGDDLLKFGGLGFSFDSAAAMGACLMREPYTGAAGKPWLGVQLADDEAFRDIVRRCAAAGLRVQVQCSGGGAIDKVLRTYEEVDREIPIQGKRWTIQHCQFPSAHNMADCLRLGVLPTTTTNFLWMYGSVYRKAFGEELAQQAIPFRSWLDSGVPIAQSTDGNPFQPMFAFWQLIARKDAVSGQALGDPAQRISRQEALRTYTLNGARTAFWDEVTGSIEPGKYADLAVLSQDILAVDEDRIPQTRVLATLLGGRPVHDTGLFSR
ncbi:amidohydrolase [Ramlibacter henchirensis]|uniref:Amidohydrolase n=1 Tax=Ramlibacter henchirensis TaxID=204072 RepID=A0A4Z0BTK1_9BURK|nr:amidohydrolase [Ramlibacter henchirensis]TFZ02626.1 amidohydrolase [Ramlibacter henchirensis]